MTQLPSAGEFAAIAHGYDTDANRSLSLRSDAYTQAKWFDADLRAIIARHW